MSEGIPDITSSEDAEAATLVPAHDVATSAVVNTNEQDKPVIWVPAPAVRDCILEVLTVAYRTR